MRSRDFLTAAVLVAALVAATGVLRLAAASADVRPAVTERFRIAVSLRNIGDDVNENDARVALRMWAEAVARQSGLVMEYPPSVVSTTDEIVRLIRQRSVDAFALATDEFLEVAPFVDTGGIIVDDRYAAGGDEYLLLVHQAAPFRTLGDLAGKGMLVERGTRAGLALPWLETELSAAKLRPVAEFFGRVTPTPKPSRVVLPVFFRQTDACLVSRRSFQVMCDLNPQLGKQLRPLITSPKLLPLFLAFHRDCSRQSKSRLISALTNLQSTPYGRQALTFFQCNRLVVADAAIIQRSVDLLLLYQRERAKGAGSRR